VHVSSVEPTRHVGGAAKPSPPSRSDCPQWRVLALLGIFQLIWS